MNVLSRLTRQSIKMNRTRSIAAFSGILLAAAMFTVLTTVVFSLWDYVRRGTEAETGDYFVSCEYAEESQVNAARQDPSVSRVYDLRITGFASLFEALGPTSVYPVAAADNEFFQNMSVPLKEGRLPENSSEILIPEEVGLIHLQKEWTAWEIGQTVTLDLFDLRSA
ncbi:MAG: hypothetical protein IKY02_01890, partial [Lachnospiraceae bacterium]|nr:hypothetical protein [Lachnospiraceae bacterium]